MSCSFGRSFLKAGRDQVPRRARAPNTSQQVSGIGGYAEAILQRLRDERTLSPWLDNSLFATAQHVLRLSFAKVNVQVQTSVPRCISALGTAWLRWNELRSSRTDQLRPMSVSTRSQISVLTAKRCGEVTEPVDRRQTVLRCLFENGGGDAEHESGTPTPQMAPRLFSEPV